MNPRHEERTGEYAEFGIDDVRWIGFHTQMLIQTVTVASTVAQQDTSSIPQQKIQVTESTGQPTIFSWNAAKKSTFAAEFDEEVQQTLHGQFHHTWRSNNSWRFERIAKQKDLLLCKSTHYRSLCERKELSNSSKKRSTLFSWWQKSPFVFIHWLIAIV